MSLLLQISDAHFGTEDPTVLDALRALAQAQRPDVAVWTGDLTQRARRGQFAAARRFVATLPPLHNVAMPGNHDIPLYNLLERALQPYDNYQEAFGDDLEPEIDRADLLLLMVKTTRRWRHKHGELSGRQIERVARRLRGAAPLQLRIVATHQPLHVREADEEGQTVRSASEALDVWAQAGVDLVLSGHTHQPDCYPVPSSSRPVWMVKAGTSVSSRVRGHPNSVNLIRRSVATDPLRCDVERWDFDREAQRFVHAECTRIGLSR